MPLQLRRLVEHAKAGGPTGLVLLSEGGTGDGHTLKKLSQAQSKLLDPNADGKTDDKAKTSEGDIDLGGAVAVNILDNDTSAFISTSGKVSAGGALEVNALTSNESAAKADGSSLIERTFDAATKAVTVKWTGDRSDTWSGKLDGEHLDLTSADGKLKFHHGGADPHGH